MEERITTSSVADDERRRVSPRLAAAVSSLGVVILSEMDQHPFGPFLKSISLSDFHRLSPTFPYRNRTVIYQRHERIPRSCGQRIRLANKAGRRQAGFFFVETTLFWLSLGVWRGGGVMHDDDGKAPASVSCVRRHDIPDRSA